MTVIGGLLVAGLGALLVGWIHKRRHPADQQERKSDSAAIINIHNNVSGTDAIAPEATTGDESART